MQDDLSILLGKASLANPSFLILFLILLSWIKQKESWFYNYDIEIDSVLQIYIAYPLLENHKRSV